MILNSVHTSITSFEHRTWHLFHLELQVLSSCENKVSRAELSTFVLKNLAFKFLKHNTWVLKSLLSVLDIFNSPLKSDYGPRINILLFQTEIVREQKTLSKNTGAILVFAIRMNPQISADFRQRMGSQRWITCLIFQKNQSKLLQMTLPYSVSLDQNRKRTPSLEYFPSIIALVVFFPLPTILEQYWKCWYTYLWFIRVLSY